MTYYDRLKQIVFDDFYTRYKTNVEPLQNHLYLYDEEGPDTIRQDDIFQMERDLQKEIDKAIPKKHSKVRLYYDTNSRRGLVRTRSLDEATCLFTLGLAIPLILYCWFCDAVKYNQRSDYSIRYEITLRHSGVIEEDFL